MHDTFYEHNLDDELPHVCGQGGTGGTAPGFDGEAIFNFQL